MTNYWAMREGSLVPAHPGDPVNMVTDMDLSDVWTDWHPIAYGPIFIFEGEPTGEHKKDIENYIFAQITT